MTAVCSSHIVTSASPPQSACHPRLRASQEMPPEWEGPPLDRSRKAKLETAGKVVHAPCTLIRHSVGVDGSASSGAARVLGQHAGVGLARQGVRLEPGTEAQVELDVTEAADAAPLSWRECLGRGGPNKGDGWAAPLEERVEESRAVLCARPEGVRQVVGGLGAVEVHELGGRAEAPVRLEVEERPGAHLELAAVETVVRALWVRGFWAGGREGEGHAGGLSRGRWGWPR
eukprot:scaffold23186_cov112-Isochrysis_galbana.AAC.12